MRSKFPIALSSLLTGLTVGFALSVLSVTPQQTQADATASVTICCPNGVAVGQNQQGCTETYQHEKPRYSCIYGGYCGKGYHLTQGNGSCTSDLYSGSGDTLNCNYQIAGKKYTCVLDAFSPFPTNDEDSL